MSTNDLDLQTSTATQPVRLTGIIIVVALIVVAVIAVIVVAVIVVAVVLSLLPLLLLPLLLFLSTIHHPHISLLYVWTTTKRNVW